MASLGHGIAWVRPREGPHFIEEVIGSVDRRIEMQSDICFCYNKPDSVGGLECDGVGEESKYI